MKSNIKINKFLAIYSQILPFVGEGDDEVISKADHKAALAAKDTELQAVQTKYSEIETKLADSTKEFEALKSSKNLTDDERKALESNITKLRDEKKTTEHQLTTKLSKTEKTLKEREEALSLERDEWKTRFQSSQIHRDITDAAVSNKAHQPKQLVNMLSNQVRLEEEVGDDGKPTGSFISKIKYTETNAKGEKINLDLTVPEAVAKMKDSEDYWNLFDDGQKRGPGGRQNSGDKTDLSALAKSGDVEAYRAAKAASK